MNVGGGEGNAKTVPQGNVTLPIGQVKTEGVRSTQDPVHPMDVLENFKLEEVTVHPSTSELLLLQADSFSTLPHTQ